MPDDHVQPFSVQAQPDPPAPAIPSTAASTPLSQPASALCSSSAALEPSLLEGSAATIPHSNDIHDIKKGDTAGQDDKSNEPVIAQDDALAKMLDVIREYSQHDTAMLVGAGIVVFAILLKFFSLSQWLIALLGILFGAFGSAFFLFASSEASSVRRSAALAGFGQSLFQHKETKEPQTDNRIDQLLDATVAAYNSVQPLTDSKPKETVVQRYDRVQIASDIDPMVEQMISYFLRDFVNIPIGLVSENEHNIPLRASLATMFMNLSKKLTGMRLPETPLLGVFGLQNNFIVHLRAYRELRDSQMPIEKYVAKHANANSVLGRCYSKDERLKQYRSIAKAVCQSLLAKDDQQSVALFAVLQEIMATHVIGATLDHMCDPDYVNLAIVDYFSEKPAEQTEAVTKSDVKTHGPDHEAPITALADSILTNAASLMGQNQLEPSPEDPVPSSNGSDSGTPEEDPFKEAREFERMVAPRAAAVIGESGCPSPLPSKPVHVVPDCASSAHQVIPEKVIRPITLRDVIIHRDQHTEAYQGFMQYLQVWDAMDLVQFYVMMDLYHRQIQEGVLTVQDDLEREANRIFDMFCSSSDPDRQVPGLKHAQNGALYKNLAKKVRREPETCFYEVQGWAYHTLEHQYWQPWQMTRAAAKSNAKSNDAKKFSSTKAENSAATIAPQNGASATNQSQPVDDETMPTRSGFSIDCQQTIITPPESLEQALVSDQEQIEDNSAFSSPSIAKSATSASSPGHTLSQAPIQTASSIASIHVTDLTYQRPKTLLSTQELLYMIEIQAESGHGYMISRTFQQLEQLHISLLAHYPDIFQRTPAAAAAAAFPRWRLQPSDKVCLGLEAFLQSLLAIPELRNSRRLGWFLSKEYDQSPGGTFPDDLVNGTATNGSSGSPNSQLSGNSVFSAANLTGAGNAAAKNAKMAFKQASDASLAVGTFFKNLGGQIGSVIVTDEEKMPALFRNSNESQRSISSVHTTNSTVAQGAPPPTAASSTTPSLRSQPSMRHLARTASSESVQSIQSMKSFMSHNSTIVDPAVARHYHLQQQVATAETATSNGSSLKSYGPSRDNNRQSNTEEAGVISADANPQRSVDYNPWNDQDTQSRRGTLDGQGHRPMTAVLAAPESRRASTISPEDQSDRASVATTVSYSETTNASDEKRASIAPSSAASTPTPARASTPALLPIKGLHTPTPPPKPTKIDPPTLLSGDELDLLIETTFTVLEDMLDFTKGQAIRRMTFGMLRELVRKSYRTAINQSFSEWALQNTSHEKAVELVQWMKDDFFWPNGEWPVAVPEEDGKATPGAGGQRTEEQKAATKEEARRLMRRALPASMVAVLGRDACVRAMTDVFEMFQIRELNLGLAMSVFEMAVRLVLTK